MTPEMYDFSRHPGTMYAKCSANAPPNQPFFAFITSLPACAGMPSAYIPFIACKASERGSLFGLLLEEGAT